MEMPLSVIDDAPEEADVLPVSDWDAPDEPPASAPEAAETAPAREPAVVDALPVSVLVVPDVSPARVLPFDVVVTVVPVLLFDWVPLFVRVKPPPVQFSPAAVFTFSSPQWFPDVEVRVPARRVAPASFVKTWR